MASCLQQGHLYRPFIKTPRKSGPTNEKPVLTSLSGAGDSNQAGGGQVQRFEKQNERMRRSSRLPLGSVRGKGRLKALPTAAYSHDRFCRPSYTLFLLVVLCTR